MSLASLDLLVELADISLDAFGVCEIGRDYSLRCDPHGSAIVHFVLKGEGSFLSDRGRFHLAPGEVIIVPEGLRHSLRGIGPIKHFRDTNRASALGNGLISFRAFEGAADLVLASAVLSARLGGKLPLIQHLYEPVLERYDDDDLFALFPEILGELSAPSADTRASVTARMRHLIVRLLKSRASSKFSLLLPTMHPCLAEVVAAVLSRPQDDHSFHVLAAIAGMSDVRFRYHFSKACNCRPQEFVLAVRLASAAQLLRNSDLQIKQIATSVGASPKHFSREFHGSYGLTPSEFRRPRASPRPNDPTWDQTRKDQAPTHK